MERWETALMLSIVAALAWAGFIAGASSGRFPRAPWIAAGAVVAGYAVLIVVTGVYTAACTSCGAHMSYDSARSVDLVLAVFAGALLTAGIVLCISVGSLSATLFHRLLR